MTPPFQRRLQAEWNLLTALAALNPDRLVGLRADDTTMHAVLRMPKDASVTVPRWEKGVSGTQDHAFSVQYPVHFPAVPMEMFLHTPVQHPNVHPETGFVCLWDRHRVSNTVEHAVHKLAAMLDGTLFNGDAVHVMQPAALLTLQALDGRVRPVPLQGVSHPSSYIASPAVRRKRLQ